MQGFIIICQEEFLPLSAYRNELSINWLHITFPFWNRPWMVITGLSFESVVSRGLTKMHFFFYFFAEGIPSVGMSPFACGWSTKQRKVSKLENLLLFLHIIRHHLGIIQLFYIHTNLILFNMHLQLASANASQIIQSLHAGFVPVSCCTKCLNHYSFNSKLPKLLAWVIHLFKQHMVVLEYVSYLLVISYAFLWCILQILFALAASSWCVTVMHIGC